MTANEWELNLTLRRRPSERKRGQISDEDMTTIYNELVQLAHTKGYTLGGIPKAVRFNCPHCGKILRGPTIKKTCPHCMASLGAIK